MYPYLNLLAKFIWTSSGTRRLVINNYTFHKSGHGRPTMQRWRCSSRRRGCKCFVMLDQDESTILRITGEHSHPPPKICDTGATVGSSEPVYFIYH